MLRKWWRYAVVLLSMVGLVATRPVPSAAQDVRTNKEMEEFVAKASTAADHAALSRHFSDMAAQYEADADTHTELAAEYRRSPENPNRRSGDPGSHCESIARRAREAATLARALAADHERIAREGLSNAKAPTKVPNISMPKVRYPDLLTPQQVQDLVAFARTPADHSKLSRHFATEAALDKADADSHAAMATGYRASNLRGRSESMAVHCDRLVQLIRESARDARDLAAYHEKLAK